MFVLFAFITWIAAMVAGGYLGKKDAAGLGWSPTLGLVCGILVAMFTHFGGVFVLFVVFVVEKLEAMAEGK